MAGYRDIKRQARRALHGILEVPALYLVPASAPTNPYDPIDPEYAGWTPPPGPYFETPVPVTVRIHSQFVDLGDMKGTNFHYAERHETAPKIIFMRDQVDRPQRYAIVSVEAGEAYEIDNIMPPDDITVTAEVLRLKPPKTDGLPLPS